MDGEIAPPPAHPGGDAAGDVAGELGAHDAAAAGDVAGEMPADAGTGLKVQCANPAGGAAYAITPTLILVNDGAPVPLAELTAKYWYTIDTVQTLVALCDYATVGCSNVIESFTAVSPSRPGADTYLEVAFATGELAAGTTSEVMARIEKTDFSSFDQTNDYSHSTSTTPVDCPRVTLYRSGSLVWGAEP